MARFCNSAFAYFGPTWPSAPFDCYKVKTHGKSPYLCAIFLDNKELLICVSRSNSFTISCIDIYVFEGKICWTMQLNCLHWGLLCWLQVINMYTIMQLCLIFSFVCASLMITEGVCESDGGGDWLWTAPVIHCCAPSTPGCITF